MFLPPDGDDDRLLAVDDGDLAIVQMSTMSPLRSHPPGYQQGGRSFRRKIALKTPVLQENLAVGFALPFGLRQRQAAAA